MMFALIWWKSQRACWTQPIALGRTRGARVRPTVAAEVATFLEQRVLLAASVAEASALAPLVTPSTTNEDTLSSSGLVISPNAGITEDVTHFRISNIRHGTLYHNDCTTSITNGNFITTAQAASGLKFRPFSNFFGTGFFDVQASTTNTGAGLVGDLATGEITVTAIADTPTVTNAVTNEDTQTTSGLVINRSPADGPEVSHVKITNIQNGLLYLNDGTTAISDGTFITFAQANAGLKFTPRANFFGTASFNVQASKGNSNAGLGGGVSTVIVTVNTVADAPSVTSAITNEDTASTSGLVISRNPNDGAEVTHFKIDYSGVSGFLYQNDGATPISNGSFITVAQGNAGLKFQPYSNFFGQTSFFVLASTSNNNAGISAFHGEGKILVNGIADTPSVTNATTNEDTQTTSGLVINRSPGDGSEVSHFRITNINNGTLYRNDGTTPITAGAFITVAQGNAGLKFTPSPNFYGTASFAVQASTSSTVAGLGGGVVTATITVNPINDLPEVTLQNIVASLPENTSTVNGVKVAAITLSDDELGTNVLSLTGVDAAVFEIFKGSLFLKPATKFNYETKNSYSVTVNVDDTTVVGAPDDSVDYVLSLTDVNEFTPVVGPKQFLIGENSVNGAFIGTIPATDMDTAQARTFSITAGNTSNAFAIDPLTGALTINNTAALNFETTPQFSLTVQAMDNGVPAKSGSAIVTISLSDKNDPPVVKPKQFLIGENSLNNAFIGTIAATDDDASQTRVFAITMGNTNSAFTIDPNTGVLSVNNSAALNFEVSSQFDLMVTATDNGSPIKSGSAAVTVFLKDVNEFSPVVTPKQFLIAENSLNNAFIGTIIATDSDTAQTRTFTITAGDTNNAFAINPTTGVLSVNNSAALNYEAIQQFNLTIAATDNGTPAKSGSATVTVFLRDVNETPVVTPKQFLIGENSLNNAFIGTIAAIDPDAGQTRTFSIIAGNTNNAFAINPTTGVLTVNNSAALDFETTPQFNLTVRVADNGNPALSGTATVTVFLKDVAGARGRRTIFKNDSSALPKLSHSSHPPGQHSNK